MTPLLVFVFRAKPRHAFNATPPHFAMRRLLAQHAPIAARMIHVKTTRGAPLSSLALCKPIQFVRRACTPFRAVPEVPTSGSLNKVNKRREGDGFFSRFLLVLPSLLPFWIFLMLNLWNFIQREKIGWKENERGKIDRLEFFVVKKICAFRYLFNPRNLIFTCI